MQSGVREPVVTIRNEETFQDIFYNILKKCFHGTTCIVMYITVSNLLPVVIKLGLFFTDSKLSLMSIYQTEHCHDKHPYT